MSQGPAPRPSPPSPAYWRDLLRRHGLRPDRRLGQHFLFDPGALAKVVEAAELAPESRVLEVGAGVGSLTWHLAQVCREVVAVELDARLFPALEEAVGGLPGVRLVQGDILRLDLGRLMGAEPYHVVANIPYQITSRLIRQLLEAATPPERLVLTVQQEVAERIVAPPGKMSLLALSVRLYGRPEVVARIPAGAFVPPPEVESAVLRVDVERSQGLGPEQARLLFRLARAGFSQRRKQLRNALAAGMHVPASRAAGWLQAAGLDPAHRAQELSVEDWLRLTEVVAQDLAQEALRQGAGGGGESGDDA